MRPETRELSGPQGTVRLKPRSMDVLVDLAMHAEAVGWLSRLARAMLDRNRTVLALEELQPSWLASPWRRGAYVLLSRLLAGVWIGVAAACFLGLLSGSRALALAVVRDGTLGGLAMAVLDGLLLGRRPAAGPASASRFAGALAYALLAGAAAGGAVLAFHLSRGSVDALAATFLHGLLFALIFARPLGDVRFDRDVQAVEALSWSWTGALQGWLGVGALTWLLLTAGSLAGQWPRAEGGAVLSTLPNALLFALLPALLLGLEPGMVAGKTRPNHGLWLSARNAVLSGGLALAGCGVSFLAGRLLRGIGWMGSVRLLRDIELRPGLPFFAALAGCFTLLAVLRFGGLVIVKHYVLRLLLWRQGLCPLSFARFLEHATRRGLLRRAGGGYLFFHSTLMEYLAGSGGEG